MRAVVTRSRFKKDLKKAKKNPRQDIQKLQDVVGLLCLNGELPAEYLPHQLIGNYSPKQECHIQPDFLLIYEVFEDEVVLHRCGSHSELF